MTILARFSPEPSALILKKWQKRLAPPPQRISSLFVIVFIIVCKYSLPNINLELSVHTVLQLLSIL